jgi:hypothetical protein
MPKEYLDMATAVSFQILSTSSVINHPTIVSLLE